MASISKNNIKRILLSGGGTGGSVAPLLAVVEELKFPPDKGGLKGGYFGKPAEPPPPPLVRGGDSNFEFLWLGTKYGPEREMVASAGSALGSIKFRAISGGKWRRYFSFRNLIDIFKIKLAFFESLWIILKWKPNLVMSAGSFISVPVVWAAWLARVPALIHQQDIRPGLANKLMAPFAKVITVTFEKSLKDYGKRAVWTGNPVRNQLKITNYELRIKNFNLNKNLPLVLILGGGTGALAINKLIEESLGELTKFCQVMHVTGKNKSIKNYELRITNYVKCEFLEAEQMAEALKLADLVVSRAGMSALTELSYLEKPAIIIPMPDSHQTENAAMFKDAAVVLEQKDLTAKKLANEIKLLLNDEARRSELGEKMAGVMKRGANEAMIKIINEILV